MKGRKTRRKGREAGSEDKNREQEKMGREEERKEVGRKEWRKERRDRTRTKFDGATMGKFF